MEMPISPDLQASLVCEDVRVEASGAHTLVGVFNAIAPPQLPCTLFRLCVWTRWCSGEGRFLQRARILSPDENEVLCENAIEFCLDGMDKHATNAHFFGNVFFKHYGTHTVEIYLANELVIRYPLQVLPRNQG